MSEEKYHFTEGDQRNIELLPVSEQEAFYRRFSQIAMEKRIADDAWEMACNKIGDKADQLVKDIKLRLDVLEEKGE
jgi:hypothetical protein